MHSPWVFRQKLFLVVDVRCRTFPRQAPATRAASKPMIQQQARRNWPRDSVQLYMPRCPVGALGNGRRSCSPGLCRGSGVGRWGTTLTPRLRPCGATFLDNSHQHRRPRAGAHLARRGSGVAASFERCERFLRSSKLRLGQPPSARTSRGIYTGKRVKDQFLARVLLNRRNPFSFTIQNDQNARWSAVRSCLAGYSRRSTAAMSPGRMSRLPMSPPIIARLTRAPK